MKIVVAGEWRRSIFQQALSAAFEVLGCTVIPFKTLDYVAYDLQSRIERKLMFGQKMNALNDSLSLLMDRENPDVLFLYRCPEVYPQTLCGLKKKNHRLVIASYNNDNPFDDGRALIEWRLYLRYIRDCHMNYFFRNSNIEQAKAARIPHPRLLLPYYVQGFHRVLDDVPPGFRNAVLFVGHYEPDGRRQYLEHLLSNDVPLRIYGHRWDEVPRSSIIHRQKIEMAWGEDYVRLIAGAKITLVFLSGRNRDQYTTRCFEVPACGSLMIAPRTRELQEFYEEGKEAIFFSDPDELLHHVRYFAANETARQDIAEHGHRRCIQDEHSNVSRARQVLADIRALAAGRVSGPGPRFTRGILEA